MKVRTYRLIATTPVFRGNWDPLKTYKGFLDKFLWNPLFDEIIILNKRFLIMCKGFLTSVL